jgi:membrane protein DedA with SNARE-associated domain
MGIGPHQLLQFFVEYGYLAVVVAVLVDSFGLPIPGEITVILASVYSVGAHRLSIVLVVGAAALGAVVGDNITYSLGRWGGYPLLERYGKFLHLGPRRLRLARYLYERYGGHLVFAGRFIPILHIWSAVLAGVSLMNRPRFMATNAAGAVGWAALLGLAGYTFGDAAIHLGGALAGLGAPLALVIVALILLWVHHNERKWMEELERTAPGTESSAAS